ncbi:MAG: efflux RND transporter periplasmic adaptor subunit [Chlorobium sp.]|jgi:membrane fusion protein, multidrug efflux system|nr:MAG: efflux RND transporter periplasmic adaptor subunit [Chlorobium sp.]
MNHTLKNSFYRAVLVFGLCLPVLFYGCGPANDGKDSGKVKPALPVMTVNLSDATVTTYYSALLEGKVNVEIRPQVDGTLQTIFVDEGSFVKTGQPLFKIDDRVYREQYNSALASQHAAESRLVIAKLDEEKLVPLVQNKVIADIQLKTAKASMHAAQAAVEQAKAATRSAQVSLDYTVIKAPVSGYIGKIPLRLGSLVSKNQNEWLTLLSDVSEIYAYFSMSENDYMRFRQKYPGATIQDKLKQVSPVSLTMSDGTLYSEKGSIGSISGQFDQTTASIRIRAVFPNPHGLLRTGNTGKVAIESQLHKVLQVPQAATVELQDKVFVFVVGKGNKVKKQVVTVFGKSANNVIVSTGLKPGDTILTAGIEKLQDGTIISPVKNSASREETGK